MTLGSSDAPTQSLLDAASASAIQTPGALLGQERERRGLSVQQTAEALHLDAWIIEAIESDRFLALGAPVYAKGYLRKYAAMLGLAPDVIVARYDALSDTPPEPTPVPIITTTPPPRPKWPKFLGWTVIAMLLVAIGLLAYRFAMPQMSSTSTTNQDAEPVVSSLVAPATEMPATVTPPVVTRSAEPAPSSDEAKAKSQESAASQAAPVAAAPAATPTTSTSAAATRLTLEFKDSSWVEVYDAAEQRLFYDIGQPGRSRVLTGAAPLNVVIGVASAVSVRVNDQAVVIPRRANRDSARFVVEADGSVR
jgi:cytoskeleton protein RodZ